MHVRFSTVRGMPVMEEGSEEAIATIDAPLINPDTGKIEGFHVRTAGFFGSASAFLSALDIVHWGSKVRVRGEEAIAPLHELVRLEELAREGRTVLGQTILTESGRVLGTCKDVQFDTIAFYAEWIFPKRFMRWGIAVPLTSVVKVTPEAVIVRDAVTIPERATGPSVLETLDPLGTGAARMKQEL